MKLNLIAAALVVGMSAQAHAAIDNGALGNGELFISVWDGSNSYTRDLNLSIDAFQASVAASGNVNLSWTADATFSAYLATANLATLQFNVAATDRQGAVRNLTTYTAPGATNIANTVNRNTVANSIQVFANTVNSSLVGVDSAVFTSTDAGYAGKVGYGDKYNNGLNFSNAGGFESILNFMRMDSPATGVGNAVYNPYADNGNAVHVYFGADNTLHIQAVPEPESYAMLLAGLGLVGAIARRRINAA